MEIKTRISIKEIVKLLRPKHWLKNALIFVSITFSGRLLEYSSLRNVLLGFLAFSLLSSAVYVLNDIRDREADKLHEVKRNRPIASGKVSIPLARGLMAVLIVVALGLDIIADGWDLQCLALMVTYFAVNLGYSLGLKNVPFVDILLLVSGFLLRVLYGAALIHEYVSNWVLLTVISLSFYLSLGKRRNELIKSGDSGSTRRVLRFYSFNFLDKFMYLCLTIAIVFYALWSADAEVIARFQTDKLIWTVPIVILLMMKYSSDIESDSHGDPVDVITRDKVLLGGAVLYGIVMLALIYCGK